MKISIIIPVYNVESFITDCLRSVISQTYKGELECILVNDCGSDNSVQIAEEFIRTYTGPIDFRIIHRKVNGGLSSARNTGMQYSTGDYLYFLDSDDEITSNCIDSLTAPLQKQLFDVVVGQYKVTGRAQWLNCQSQRNHNDIILNGRSIMRSYVNGEWYVMAWNKLYRSEFLKNNDLLFYDGLIHEDELWTPEVACLAQSFCMIKDICYDYKVRTNSIMTVSNEKRKQRNMTNVLLLFADFANKNKLRWRKEVNVFIRNKSNYYLNKEKDLYSAEKQRKMYIQFREKVFCSWWSCFITNGLNWKAQLLDLHLLLPISFGYWYRFKLLSKFL